MERYNQAGKKTQVRMMKIGYEELIIIQSNEKTKREREICPNWEVDTGLRETGFEAMVGANTNAYTAGLDFNFSFINLGLVYEFVRTDLDGGPFENRIATEFGIKSF